MRVTRRQLLGGAATFGLIGAITGPGSGAAQAAGAQYPFLVPELYRPIPDAPDRLAAAGLSVTMLERRELWEAGETCHRF